MKKHLTVDFTRAKAFFNQEDLPKIEQEIIKAHNELHEGTGKGNDFVGWVNLPNNYDREEFDRIKKAAKKIQSDSEILLVVGIGGSYLGAKAALEALNKHFTTEKKLEIIFVGHHISSSYMMDLLDYIKGKDFSINVISKSGTTTEPAIAFRAFKKVLIEKYGEVEARNRIYATTDKEKGALRTLATKEGYETFVVPDNVGGRFSILTAVGLLPIAASGLDVDQLMLGAKDAYQEYLEPSLENEAYKYVALRNLLYRG